MLSPTMILLFAKAKTDLFFNIVSLSVHTLPVWIPFISKPSSWYLKKTLFYSSYTGSASQLGAFSCSESNSTASIAFWSPAQTGRPNTHLSEKMVKKTGLARFKNSRFCL